MSPMIIENYIKNSVQDQKYPYFGYDTLTRLKCQTPKPDPITSPSFFFSSIISVWLGLVIVPDSSDLGLTTLPKTTWVCQPLDQCILILTATSNPTVLGLVTMSSPRFLGLAWLPDPTCLSLAPTPNPSYLGNISTHSGARTNVLVNC
jgi:hypothetical protein